MKNLKMFAIGLVAFAAMTMGVHAAATAKASFTDKDGLTHDTTNSSTNTFATLIEAADQYSVDNDVQVEVTISDADFSEAVASDIQINGDVVLNLGDYKLSLTGVGRFVVKGGTLTVNGTADKAIIENTTSATGTLIRVEGEDSHLKIEKGVTIDNKCNTDGVGAIVIFGDTAKQNSSKNSSVEISGTIKSLGGIAVAVRGDIAKSADKVAPTVKINDGAVIDSEKTGYYQAGYAIGTIGKATITGTNGVSIKAGTLTLNGPTITGTAETSEMDECTGNGSAGATYVTGAAVQIEGNASYDSPAKVTFNGGTYTSENASAVKACAFQKEAIAKGSKINDGEFTSGEDEKGEPLPNIDLAFFNTNTDTDVEWINDLEGFIVKGTFNGPVVGTATVGANTMNSTTLLAKLTKGASVVTDDEGNSVVNGSTAGQKPSDENKPNTGDTANTPSDSKNPQTGDSIMTYMGLGIASIAVVGLGAKNLKKQTSR